MAPLGKRLVFTGLFCGAVLGISGCLGPAMVHCSQARYNRAVQSTANEELLLNLVRLRYGEGVKFLPMTSITAQFDADFGADFLGGIDQQLPTQLGTGHFFFSERPTLTFDPRRNPEFTHALLSRPGVDTLDLLDAAGWDFGRLFRLLVQNINGIGNALGADGPTPAHTPDFAEYKHLASLLERLHEQQLLVFGVESRSSSVTVDSIHADAFVNIQKAGYEVRSLGEKRGFVLTETKDVRGMRVLPAATAELVELIQILRLLPGQSFYEIELAPGGQVRPTDSAPQSAKLTLSTRSPLETMYFLAHAISVPLEHLEKGLVTVTLNPDGTPFDWGMVTGDLLRVCAAKRKPKRAAVSVLYRHYWYYIDDADVASKTTLALFQELLRLQKGGGAGDQPLLTIPVGGRR